MSYASGSSPASTPSQGDSPPGTDAASAAGTMTRVAREDDSETRTCTSVSVPASSVPASSVPASISVVSPTRPNLANSAPIGQESVSSHRDTNTSTPKHGAGHKSDWSRSVDQVMTVQKKTVAQHPLGFPAGPEPNSWEAVATSWILPDVVHVIWRAALLATTICVFATGMKTQPVSVVGFSFEAYVMSIITASLLLLPCVIALGWNDGNILDSKTSRWIWTGCAAILLFTSALVTVSWMGYRVYTPGQVSRSVSDSHWVLSVLFQTELFLDAMRLTVGHLIAAYVMGGIYIVFVRTRVCGPSWLYSLLVQSLRSFAKAYLVFLAVVTAMYLLVRARTILTDSLERHRERDGMVHLSKSNTLKEVTAN